jgi:hypothetical protein
VTKPDKAAGIAGILAGAGLLIEFVFFMASGWQPDVFADPAVALAFLEERGGYMRAAGLAGAVNLCFATIFVAGLAARLQREPTVATAERAEHGCAGPPPDGRDVDQRRRPAHRRGR